ncbi:MAG: hypothetical protein ACOC38_02745, partial [Promethearchaeia archaeon]
AGVYMAVTYYYVYKGFSQQLEMSKGKRSAPEGFGAWYARNITGFIKSVTFSSIVFTGPYLILLLIAFLMLPSQFGAIVESTWQEFSFFTLIGFVNGFHFWSETREDS